MSNRFPADDEHLYKYPGNLKHHKVSPAMERTIPEVYRAALATLESLIEDGYDHAKERQRKLLCEMMEDDAKSGLYNEELIQQLVDEVAAWMQPNLDERFRGEQWHQSKRILNAAAAAGFKPTEQ